MNHEFENIGRDLPYDLPEHSMDSLRERIRAGTTARPTEPARHRTVRGFYLATAGVAGVCVLLAGLLVSEYHIRKAENQVPDLEQLLKTASAETLHQAAADNYDDILYNQQL